MDGQHLTVLTLSVLEYKNSMFFPQALQAGIMQIIFRDKLFADSLDMIS